MQILIKQSCCSFSTNYFALDRNDICSTSKEFIARISISFSFASTVFMRIDRTRSFDLTFVVTSVLE